MRQSGRNSSIVLIAALCTAVKNEYICAQKNGTASRALSDADDSSLGKSLGFWRGRT